MIIFQKRPKVKWNIFVLDNPKKTQTIPEAIRQIYRQNGFPGLFAGLVPRVIKVAPACAIMIATFEHSKQVFYRLSLSRIEKQPQLESSNLNTQKQSDNIF